MNFTAATGTGQCEVTCSFLPPEPGRHITFFIRRVTDLDGRPVITLPMMKLKQYLLQFQLPLQQVKSMEPEWEYGCIISI